MDSPQHLKKRLKSVANINKITKAMELVAATKMRRSQEIALASRPYAFAALDLLARITLMPGLDLNQKKTVPGIFMPELFWHRNIKKVLFVLVASDKGLAGAFNSALFRKFEQYIGNLAKQYANEERIFLAVGEKAAQYLQKKGLPIVRKFVNIGDFIDPKQIQPMTDFIIEGYLEKKWDRVVIFSTNFKSALRQEPSVRRVLPVSFEHIKETVLEILPETGKFVELIKEQSADFLQVSPKNRPSAQLSQPDQELSYLIEPSAEIVLNDLARHLIAMQIYHVVLEANAAEHSARRLAMKTASDNAFDLGQALHLQYNKSRQSGITNQIIEISAGAEALS